MMGMGRNAHPYSKAGFSNECPFERGKSRLIHTSSASSLKMGISGSTTKAVGAQHGFLNYQEGNTLKNEDLGLVPPSS